MGGISPWEGCAVVLAITYLLLAARENIWCWLCALISTAIYTVLFWNVSLLMDSALNVYYMIMAVYGWYEWRYGGQDHSGVPIRMLTGTHHLVIITMVLITTVISGYLLSRHTTAAWPFVDSFTTWASVVTTFMVAKKILENWLYWIVIDTISIALYIDRGLYLTAVLFMAYVIIAIGGYFTWRQRLLADNPVAVNA